MHRQIQVFTDKTRPEDNKMQTFTRPGRGRGPVANGRRGVKVTWGGKSVPDYITKPSGGDKSLEHNGILYTVFVFHSKSKRKSLPLIYKYIRHNSYASTLQILFLFISIMND